MLPIVWFRYECETAEMTDDPVPRPLVVLGEHFRPMAEMLGKRMDEVPVEAGEVSDIFGLVDEHTELLTDHVVAFGEAISEGLGRLTHEADEYFHEVASRLNAELEGLLDGYDDVRRLKPHEEDFEGWVLLVEIYEETLFQIQFWLEEVVEFLDDPVAGVKKRGIPADGNGAVNLRLEMQSPRQVRQLTRWLQSRGRDLRVAQEKSWAQEDRRRAHRAGLIVGSLIGWWTRKG